VNGTETELVLSEERPLPSAILLGTETAARRIWLVKPYRSSLENSAVSRYTRIARFIAACHTSKSL